MTQDKDQLNHWIADEGKIFYKDGIYAYEIWLGVNDSIENWIEINEEDIPDG